MPQRAHRVDLPDLPAPSAALQTARTQPEPPFGRPPHPELQLPSSGASEPVDARFELAPLDDGQLERVEVARLQELKIAHLHSKGCIPPPAAVLKRGHAMLPSSTRLPIGDFSHCAWERSLGGEFGSPTDCAPSVSNASRTERGTPATLPMLQEPSHQHESAQPWAAASEPGGVQRTPRRNVGKEGVSRTHPQITELSKEPEPSLEEADHRVGGLHRGQPPLAPTASE